VGSRGDRRVAEGGKRDRGKGMRWERQGGERARGGGRRRKGSAVGQERVRKSSRRGS
jgi:hypothetical protein